MDQYFTSYSPNCRVTIFDTQTGGNARFYDVSDDIISLGTIKAYGRCSGTWQIILTYVAMDKDGERYSDKLRVNDTITIELDAGDGSGLKPIMRGLIDRVSPVPSIFVDTVARTVRTGKYYTYA